MNHELGTILTTESGTYKVICEVSNETCIGCAFNAIGNCCPPFSHGCGEDGVIFVALDDDPIIGRTIKSYDYVGGDMKLTFTDGTEQLIQSGNDRDHDTKCMLEKDWDWDNV